MEATWKVCSEDTDDDRGRAVGFAADEGAVHRVEEEHGEHHRQHARNRRHRHLRDLYSSATREKTTLLLALHLHLLVAVAQIGHEATQQRREALGGENAGDGREREHQTNHDSSREPRPRVVPAKYQEMVP